MTNTRNRSRWVAQLLGLSVVVSGCGSADEPAPPAIELVGEPAVTPGAEANDLPVVVAAAREEPARGDAEFARGELAEFEPPFPNRTELFEPPRGGQGMVRRDEELGETIELKGFVNVNGPQVVLAIDGVISPIPEGGEKYGVQVISIHPPSVVLQRGRSRWTASLD